MTTIVHLGHDGALDPSALVAETLSAIRDSGADVLASITGTSWSADWGTEPGTWIVVREPDTYATSVTMQDRVLAVAARHGQEAVAFTRGTNVVLGTTDERAA